MVKNPPSEVEASIWHFASGFEARFDVTNIASQSRASLTIRTMMGKNFPDERFSHNGQFVFDVDFDGLDLKSGETQTLVWSPGFLEPGYFMWSWVTRAVFADGSTWDLYE